MKVLGIETSCDETSAAVLHNKCVLSNVINSQIEIHKQYGGVVPEYAARNHMENIDKCIELALKQADIDILDIDAIASTTHPGLIGGLLVGTVTAKTLAIALNKPFMAINHLEGHLLTPRLCYEIICPFLCILASGGHFLIIEVEDVGKYKILGKTLDDAAGESLDKVAKLLGLNYPGGPEIEKLAMSGNKDKFSFPIPLLKSESCNISFSGLKTAARNFIENNQNINKADLAASFQWAIITAILHKTQRALRICSSNISCIVLAGGVAANKLLRTKMEELAENNNLKFFAPPISLCCDNAAMIAWACIERKNKGIPYSPITFPLSCNWDL